MVNDDICSPSYFLTMLGNTVRLLLSCTITSMNYSMNYSICVQHCKDKIPNFETNIPSPNFHIHASVSDLYIPTLSLPILLEEICRPILGLCKSLTDT
jgi:hypothetical protein